VKLRDLLDQGAQSRPLVQDVVYLMEQVAGGCLFAPDPGHLGKLHRTRTAMNGSTNWRTGTHRLREPAVGLLQVAAVHSEPRCGGEREHANGVVVHPMLIDNGECQFQVSGSSSAVGDALDPGSAVTPGGKENRGQALPGGHERFRGPVCPPALRVDVGRRRDRATDPDSVGNARICAALRRGLLDPTRSADHRPTPGHHSFDLDLQ
jgi:hypothetical protein